MTWIFWLGLAVAIGIVAAVTGMKPSGTRPVARTRLMGMARFVLIVVLLLFLYLAYRGYSAP
jgi:heme/copper-type cytochrome/quinol oxidase subunit 4